MLIEIEGKVFDPDQVAAIDSDELRFDNGEQSKIISVMIFKTSNRTITFENSSPRTIKVLIEKAQQDKRG